MQTPDRSILLRCLSGEASPEEAAQLDSWLNASPGNKQEFDALWQLWLKTSNKAAYRAPDIESDWQVLHTRIQAAPGAPSLFRTFRAGVWKVVAAIAACAIITGIILIKVKKDPPAPPMVVRHSGATILKDSVPGGTLIIMGEQSIFSYPSICQRMLDTAWLTKGKVYIQSAAMPFSIRTGELVVLKGNSDFLLDNDSATGVISLQVSRGVVEVRHGADNYIVQEGHSLLYDMAMHRGTEKKSVDPNTLAFATGVFSFTDVPLKEVAAVLAKAYNVTIQLNNPAIGDCRITGQFDYLPIKQVLDLIATTFNTTYSIEQEGKMIYLNGKGCE